MKKIIKQTSEKGIVQITIADERWYVKDEAIGPVFVPSVTWISSFYPKGVGYMKWLANHGWDEAEAIKNEAAEKGSRVHQAIVDLVDGKKVAMNSKYVNVDSDKEEELTLDDWECITSFVDWWNEMKPETLAREVVIFSKTDNYAGTVDWIGKIGDKIWLIDFKTSQYVWPSHELQVSAYRRAWDKIDTVGILQLGYRLNKKRWKLTEIGDKFDLFKAAQRIWFNETEGIEPKKREYPEMVQLPKPEKVAKVKTKKTNGRKRHTKVQRGRVLPPTDET